MNTPKQLFLELPLAEHLSFDNFFVGDNGQVITHLQQPLSDLKSKIIFLVGSRGVGKTHLLQACCQAALAQGQTASYLPLNQSELQAMPEVLNNMDGVNVLCLDNLEYVVGCPQWEEALFHGYNRVLASSQARLIITAQYAPNELTVHLVDLKSRLNAALPFQLKPLSDVHKTELLIARAHTRGLQLEPHVAEYLIQHYSRALSDLLENLKRLDEASLTTQRKITIPLIKEVL